MSKLLQALDQASTVRHLNEALWMAFSDIDDREQRSALQELNNVVAEQLGKLTSMLEELRGEVRS